MVEGSLEEFIKYVDQEAPKLREEFIRKTTPFYYEMGVKYHPITNGFGCDHNGSNEPYEIKHASYHQNGELHVTMVPDSFKRNNGIMTMSRAHKQFKRVDDSVKPIGKPILNSMTHKYMTIEGANWNIYLNTTRHYETNGLQVHAQFRNESLPSIKTYGSATRKPYWTIYSSAVDNRMILKEIYDFDSVDRESYRLHGLNGTPLTVRQIKQLVFGNPDVKIHCQIFGKYGKL